MSDKPQEFNAAFIRSQMDSGDFNLEEVRRSARSLDEASVPITPELQQFLNRWKFSTATNRVLGPNRPTPPQPGVLMPDGQVRVQRPGIIPPQSGNTQITAPGTVNIVNPGQVTINEKPDPDPTTKSG